MLEDVTFSETTTIKGSLSVRGAKLERPKQQAKQTDIYWTSDRILWMRKSSKLSPKAIIMVKRNS